MTLLAGSKTVKLVLWMAWIGPACVLVACHDNRFESHYRSIAEAVNDHAVERQWIPEFLPKSSRNIHLVGNLSPSQEWCAFEFVPGDSEQLRRSLKPIEELPPSLRHVPKLEKPWWPLYLEGDLEVKAIRDHGLQLYVVEERATASASVVELFAVDWAKGSAYFYAPPG